MEKIDVNDNRVVHLACAQTASGTKTFNACPLVAAPTACGHATMKSYLGVAVADGTPDAVAGVKGGVRRAGDLGGIASAPKGPAVRLERW